MAIAEPERVHKLVTIGGMGKNTLSPGPGEGIKLLMEFTDNPTREGLIRWLHSMVYDPATRKIAQRMYSSKAFAATMKMAQASNATPYWAQLHKVTCPTLLTWGRDDRVSPVDMALLPMRDIPNAELHVFPRCGHWTMIEAKQAWVSAVLAFLRRDEQVAAS